MATKKYRPGTINDVTRASQDLNLDVLLPKHAEIYNYSPTPITPEKVLSCLLSTGDCAVEEAEQADNGGKKVASLQRATLSFKYAYLLRDEGIAPDIGKQSPIPAPTQDQLNERLVEIIAQVARVEKQQVTTNASFEDLDISGLSGALDLLQIVMEIQDQFHVRISDDDVEKWDTIGDVQRYLEQKEVV